MTTLIEVRKSNGKLVGRCDMRCFNAKGKRCSCVCGGKNHGIGFLKALANTNQMDKEELEAGDHKVKFYHDLVDDEMRKIGLL